MKKKRYKAEQIISKLREAEVALGKGAPAEAVCKQLEVSEPTYYRWRKQYGGMKKAEMKRLKELEKENTRLKKIVAEQAVDLSILKEVAQGNF